MSARMEEKMDYDALFSTMQFQSRQAHIDWRGAGTDAGEDVAALFKDRVGIEHEGVYMFRLTPSTQAFDSYGTRMSEQSMRTYVLNAIAGTPFMNSHRTGPTWYDPTPTELALGHTFDGALVGEAIDETPLLKRKTIPMTDALEEMGLQLKTWDYVVRGYWPNGKNQLGTDDVVLGMETKSIRQLSIGFGSNGPARVAYICGLCGLPMGRAVEKEDGTYELCNHVPFMRDKESGLMAFAWVRNAMMYEHSMVWAGATPGAVVNQARRVARTGNLNAEELDFLEDLWRVPIRPQSAIVLDLGLMYKEGKLMSDTDEREEMGEDSVELVDEGAVVVESDESRVEPAEAEEEAVVVESDESEVEPTDEVAVSERAIVALSVVLTGLTDDIKAVGVQMQEMADRQSSMIERLEAVEQAQAGPLSAADNAAQALLDDLRAQAVAARVRALGQETFNANDYKELLTAMSVAQIKSEIATYEEVARQTFRPGRVASAEQDKAAHIVGRERNVELYKV